MFFRRMCDSTHLCGSQRGFSAVPVGHVETYPHETYAHKRSMVRDAVRIADARSQLLVLIARIGPGAKQWRPI